MTEQWTDRIVGDRMTVDQEFSDRVAQSQFSRQQWGLIMTAIEFEIDQPDDPEAARLVADTSDLRTVVPELDKVDQRQPGMGGTPSGQSSGGSIVGTLKDALGLGGGGGGGGSTVDEDQLAEAEALVQEYAETLQTHLEDRGKWADVRAEFRASQ